ncbi:hypothetical protein JHK84_028124 [Glycine max]|nr:hypothetical protein JHK84_028124 [Glycine max]
MDVNDLNGAHLPSKSFLSGANQIEVLCEEVESAITVTFVGCRFLKRLCDVGEFYEAWGINVCILVEYEVLNPFGGLQSDSIPRAGCPVVLILHPGTRNHEIPKFIARTRSESLKSETREVLESLLTTTRKMQFSNRKFSVSVSDRISDYTFNVAIHD